MSPSETEGPAIVVQIAPEVAGAPEEDRLIAWAEAAREAAGVTGELVIRVADTDEITHLNAEFRGKEAPTNVLSFPADLPDGPWEPVLGDVVICPRVVAREAAEQNKAEVAHWAHMVVHGVLHLAGYDHQEEAEAEVMEDRERAILAGLGFGDPYAGEG